MKSLSWQPVSMGLCIVFMVFAVGCEPPPPTVQDLGRPIEKITVKEDHIPVYENKTIDGVDFLVSPYPIGKFGDTLYNAGIGTGPKTFNPLVANDATSSSLGGLMFEGLITRNAHTGLFEPRLAKTFTIAEDKRTYTITMRHGITWSDGHPITADDVVFTWNDIIKKGLGNRSTLDVVKVDGIPPAVRKIDDYTVEFVTPVPFAPFLSNLSNSILPKHIIEPVIKNNPAAFDSFWGVDADPASLVVSGLFKLHHYETGHRVVFERNPHYYIINKEGKRLPYLDRYVMDIVRDLNAQKLLFEQGRNDTLSVPGQDVFYVKQLMRPDFQMIDLGPTTGTSFLTFNLNPRKDRTTGKYYVDPVKQQWFGDINFRRAVDYAIRRDQMVQNILRGVGSPLFTAEALSSIFLNEKLADGHPYDLEKAREFLKQSGFYWDKAGDLYDKAGNRVEFELLTNAGNTERESVGVSIKEDLAKIGMKINFKPIEFNVLVGKVSDSLEWEAIVLGLTGSAVEPNGGVNVWRHDGALHLFNTRKPERDMPGTDKIEPWELEIDKAFNEGAKAIDFEDRKPFYDQYQQVAYDYLPMIYLYSPKRITAINNRVKNLDPTPLADIFHNLESIWIKSN